MSLVLVMGIGASFWLDFLVYHCFICLLKHDVFVSWVFWFKLGMSHNLKVHVEIECWFGLFFCLA